MSPSSPASIHEALKYLESRRPIEIEVERDEARRKRRAIEYARQIEEMNRRKEEANNRKRQLAEKKKERQEIESRPPKRPQSLYPQNAEDALTKRIQKTKAYNDEYRKKNREKILYKNYLRRMEKWENDIAMWKAGLLPEYPRKPFMSSKRPEGEYAKWKEEWTLRKRRAKLGT